MKGKFKLIGILSLLASSICITQYFNILHAAKLIGDSKGGNYGNPVQAMAKEDQALPFLIAAPILLTFAFNCFVKIWLPFRILFSIIIFLILCTLIFLMGFSV